MGKKNCKVHDYLGVVALFHYRWVFNKFGLQRPMGAQESILSLGGAMFTRINSGCFLDRQIIVNWRRSIGLGAKTVVYRVEPGRRGHARYKRRPFLRRRHPMR